MACLRKSYPTEIQNLLQTFGILCLLVFETKLLFSTSYHPQIDGHTKRVNQVLEDMLRMHVMHQPKKWEDYLPLVEFAYNNGYQESLKMSPFEALYGRQCNIPISWNNPIDIIMIGLDMLKEMEQ
jgi:hypothetical protein